MDYRPTSEMAIYNKQLSSYQLQFVIAHEIGHVFLDHLNKESSIRNFKIEGIQGENEQSVHAYNHKKLQELEADFFAINYYKSSVINEAVQRRQEDDVLNMIYKIPCFRMAVELLFVFLNLIEEASAILYNSDVIKSTHPLAIERLDNIRIFYQIDILNDRKTIAFAEYIFSLWLKGLKESKLHIGNIDKLLTL